MELGRKGLGLTCLRQLSLSFSTDVSSVASSSHSAPSAEQMCSRSTLPAKIFSSCTNIAPPPEPAPAARTREGHRGWREDQGRGRAAARSFAGRRRPAPAPVGLAARHWRGRSCPLAAAAAVAVAAGGALSQPRRKCAMCAREYAGSCGFFW